jgi:hypothetical protein
LTEGILIWKSYFQKSSAAASSSGPVSLALILGFLLQIIIDGIIIPMSVQGHIIYVLKVYFTTLLFFVLLPLLIVVRNELMQNQLRSVLPFHFPFKTNHVKPSSES